jgi:hypothetical protein
LTVRKVCATYTGTNSKHVVHRVKHIRQLHHGDDDLKLRKAERKEQKPPTWYAKYQSGFMTLPPALLLEQPAEIC